MTTTNSQIPTFTGLVTTSSNQSGPRDSFRQIFDQAPATNRPAKTDNNNTVKKTNTDKMSSDNRSDSTRDIEKDAPLDESHPSFDETVRAAQDAANNNDQKQPQDTDTETVDGDSVVKRHLTKTGIVNFDAIQKPTAKTTNNTTVNTAGQTTGQTAEIIDKTKTNLEWATPADIHTKQMGNIDKTSTFRAAGNKSASRMQTEGTANHLVTGQKNTLDNNSLTTEKRIPNAVKTVMKEPAVDSIPINPAKTDDESMPLDKAVLANNNLKELINTTPNDTKKINKQNKQVTGIGKLNIKPDIEPEAPTANTTPAKTSALKASSEQTKENLTVESNPELQTITKTEIDTPANSIETRVPDIVQPTQTGIATPASSSIPAIDTPEAQDIQLGQQIIDKINITNNLAGKRIAIELTPPDLGKVQVIFRSVGAKLMGIIKPDNQNTMLELQKEAPGLIARMAEAGINVKSLEFQMNKPQQGRDGGDEANSSFQSDNSAFSGAESGGGKNEDNNDAGHRQEGNYSEPEMYSASQDPDSFNAENNSAEGQLNLMI